MRQAFAEEIPNEIPALRGRLHAVARSVHGEKGVPGSLHDMELVVLAGRIELDVDLRHLLRRRVLVVTAEQSEDGAPDGVDR